MASALASFPTPRRPDLLLTWGAVAAAWTITIVLVATGAGESIVDHDAVLGGSRDAWPITILLFLVSWQLMTAAMMLPSSMPMIAMYLRVARRQDRPRLAFGRFLLGYFAVWTGFALVALAGDAGVHWLAGNIGLVGERPWLIGGAILLLAGAFQLSPLKERCLDACRDPMAFLWSHYIAGPRSAWRLGVHHGLFCLGCCWALMLTMFAVGMGGLVWMTALTGVMLIEKTTRHGRRLAAPIGAVLVIWGALVMLHPGWLPVLVRGT